MYMRDLDVHPVQRHLDLFESRCSFFFFQIHLQHAWSSASQKEQCPEIMILWNVLAPASKLSSFLLKHVGS